MNAVSRREFVTVLAAAGGGLLLGYRVGEGPRVASAAAAQGFAPNAFIRIGPDGGITLIMAQAEMGQGTHTAMSMLLAEELEVAPDQVRLEHAPPDDTLYGNRLLGGEQMTGASSSVRTFYEPLRRAGATARVMLVAAAAASWNVDPVVPGAETRRDPHANRQRMGHLPGAGR
jgi:isoquinoline 1-oxidoreductase subunit beta